MKIVKVKPADAGGYRCEVTAKDKCDSCTFEITVEGKSSTHTHTYTNALILTSHHVGSLISAAQQEQQADILSAFKRA